MPIIPNFLDGGGGNGGVKLLPASNIIAQPASEKVYIKWTDPNDIVISGTTFAEWGGTILVRKAGSMPSNRRDGAIILDSKTRNAYQDEWFCDSGLTNGTAYYYKLFPYTTEGIYTDDVADEFTATPAAVAPGNVSNISLTAAGNGKLGISWTDPAATVVSNGVTVSTWASTKVVVKTGSYATNPNDSNAAFTFNSTTRNAYASTQLVATGLTNGTTYYVSFFPISEDGAVNTNTANRKTGVPNRITISTVPSQSGTLTYNGNARTPSWSNYDSAKMTLSVTAQTNAGTYDATFTPKTDYRWSDGTTGAKTVEWTIGKATPSAPTLSNTSITLNTSTTETTFVVTRDGDGDVAAVSSNTDIVTVVATGNTTSGGKIFRVSSVNSTSGTATITIHVAEGTNYLAYTADDVMCNVSAEFIPTVLNDATWAQISEASLAGTASSYWEVGDTKAIRLFGTAGKQSLGLTLYAYIIGFDHNKNLESNGEHSIHFGTWKDSSGKDICLVDSFYKYENDNGSKFFNMNHTATGGTTSDYGTNYGGWKGCDLRYDILGSTNRAPSQYNRVRSTSCVGYDATATTATSPVSDTLMSCLPSDLRAVLRPITKYTNNVGNNSTASSAITSSVDYLPLLSEYEISYTTYSKNTYEKAKQITYDYYSSGNSQLKYKHDDSLGIAGIDGLGRWWLRTPANTAMGFFYMEGHSGYPTYKGSSGIATDIYGLAPIFMV